MSDEEEGASDTVVARNGTRMTAGPNGKFRCLGSKGHAGCGEYSLARSAVEKAGNYECTTCRMARGVDAGRRTGNCCPCKANGTRCWHGKGATKKGMHMSGYCGTCKAGKCTPEYHASGKQFPKPP